MSGENVNKDIEESAKMLKIQLKRQKLSKEWKKKSLKVINSIFWCAYQQGKIFENT